MWLIQPTQKRKQFLLFFSTYCWKLLTKYANHFAILCLSRVHFNFWSSFSSKTPQLWFFSLGPIQSDSKRLSCSVLRSVLAAFTGIEPVLSRDNVESLTASPSGNSRKRGFFVFGFFFFFFFFLVKSATE